MGDITATPDKKTTKVSSSTGRGKGGHMTGATQGVGTKPSVGKAK